ncbi:MAG: hypothetical protein Q8P41_10705 [Pseudomonadota bacterium]|nr:hypothetical protein [Pseudomonadota bacterium]
MTLLLDTNVLRDRKLTVALSFAAQKAGVPVLVPVHVWAEFLRARGAHHGAGFDATQLRAWLQDFQFKLEAFDEDDSVALEAWTRATYGDEGAYQSWKCRKCLSAVEGIAVAAGADTARMRAACDGHVGAPSTIDWLTIGMAVRRGFRIVTSEGRGPHSEFERVQDVLKPDEALRLLQDMPA